MIGHSAMQSSMEMEVEGGERLMEMPSFWSISGGQKWPQLLLGHLHEVSDMGRPAEDGGGKDFEFACVSRDSLEGFEHIAVEEIFSYGSIRAVCPFFGRTPQCQAHGHEGDGGSQVAKEPVDLCFSLREYMAVNGEPPSSSASILSASWESSDGLDGVPTESYCVWEPRSPELRKKNPSLAASKKWRLRGCMEGVGVAWGGGRGPWGSGVGLGRAPTSLELHLMDQVGSGQIKFGLDWTETGLGRARPIDTPR